MSEDNKKYKVLKVSTTSSANAVAGCFGRCNSAESGRAELQTIGAGALNQAVKAIAVARGYLAPSGYNLVCVPAFYDVVIDGEERTAIKLLVLGD